MYVIVEDRASVTQGFATSFRREGIACIGFHYADFPDWLNSASEDDLSAVDGFLLGECPNRIALPQTIHARCRAPVIALNGVKSLTDTLELFAAGVDDVVKLPVHVREVLVRTAAICRRTAGSGGQAASGAIQVFFDGRDPEIGGEPLALPRRELRILEYIVSRKGKWVTKTQVFNAIYGVFDSTFDESVIESHISKLRKKVRGRLGYDPIVSRRYLGYRLDDAAPASVNTKPRGNDAPTIATAFSGKWTIPAVFTNDNRPSADQVSAATR